MAAPRCRHGSSLLASATGAREARRRAALSPALTSGRVPPPATPPCIRHLSRRREVAARCTRFLQRPSLKRISTRAGLTDSRAAVVDRNRMSFAVIRNAFPAIRKPLVAIVTCDSRDAATSSASF